MTAVITLTLSCERTGWSVTASHIHHWQMVGQLSRDDAYRIACEAVGTLAPEWEDRSDKHTHRMQAVTTDPWPVVEERLKGFSTWHELSMRERAAREARHADCDHETPWRAAECEKARVEAARQAEYERMTSLSAGTTETALPDQSGPKTAPERSCDDLEASL